MSELSTTWVTFTFQLNTIQRITETVNRMNFHFHIKFQLNTIQRITETYEISKS